MLTPLLVWQAAAADADAPVVEVETTANGVIVIDGHLDEPDWRRAQPATTFLRFRPDYGGEPDGVTEVRFLQDDKYLYVGIRIAEADYRIRARISPREAINADDQVGVYLDTFNDERSGYFFYFNPLGIQQDIRHNTGQSSFQWNMVFKSKGHVVYDEDGNTDGYEVEVAFPWRSLKYPRTDHAQDWGLLLTRKIPSEGAKYSFPPQERGHPRIFEQGATLRGVEPAPVGSGLELIPQLTTSTGWSRETRDDELVGTEFEPLLETIRPSLDTRFGITPNIGLTATINPDFSQVENDVTPIALNQRFAFFFPERRPFFLDQQDFFVDRHGSLYSRSINQPLYGAKVAGRQGDWQVGFLNALDRTPASSFNENDTPGFRDDDVEGRIASNNLLRVRRDAFDGGNVGVTVIDKRILGGYDGGVEGPGGVHDSVGADFITKIADRWLIGGQTQQSWTGDPTSPLLPLHGHATGASLVRQSGQGTGFRLGASDLSQGFRREMGFLNQSGITGGNARIDHTFEPKSDAIDIYVPNIAAGANHERNGDFSRSASTGHRMVVRGIHTFNLGASLSKISDQGATVDGWGANGSYSGVLGSALTLTPSAGGSRTIDFSTLLPADFVFAQLTGVLRPTQGIRIDLTGRREAFTPDRQPVETASIGRMRLNWQFTVPLGMRTVLEYTEGSERDSRLRTQLVATWLVNPDTAVYLGYAEDTDLEGSPTALARSAFAKGTILFRP